MRYPEARWTPSNEMSVGRAGQPIIAVVDHSAVGPRSAVIARFTQPPLDASTHFLVNQNGSVDQFVDTDDTAWANGTLDRSGGPDPAVGWLADYYRVIDNVGGPNRVTISIEWEGGAQGNEHEPPTEAQYQAALRLHRWIFANHGLRAPKRNDTLLEHNQISATSCPSGRIPWGRLTTDLTPTPTPPTTEQRLTALNKVGSIFAAAGLLALQGAGLPPELKGQLKYLIG
jgi:N-acetyl-anhydromuramyl-L-alanine amidase AmpD